MAWFRYVSLVGVVAGAMAWARRLLRRGRRRPVPGEPSPADLVVADRLAELVRIQTVSHDERPPAAEAFAALRDWLEASYPATHASLTREVVADHSLLYTWQGRSDLDPVLLMAHLDVVPVEPGTEEEWTKPPFAAEQADGYLWGRGAMDDKASVVGIFEATEVLVQEGFQPERTVHLAFGHDEEIGGRQGAAAVASLLEERGVHLAAVLDEGGYVADGLVFGVNRPVALIGTAEKGYLSVILSAYGQGGHSSAPPSHTAVGRVAAAVSRLENRPFPVRPEVLQKTYAFLLPYLSPPKRTLFGNLGLTGPMIARRMAGDPTTNALVRTTTAATMIEGGVKQNVLPRRARAVVNFRILPGETIATTLEHITRVVGDPHVTIEPITVPEPAEPAAEASVDSPGFAGLAAAISQTFPETAIAPYTLTGMTDSRHFGRLADDVYRFAPFRVVPEDRQRIHGIDERIRLDDCGRMPRFYRTLLRHWAGPQTDH